VPLAAPVELPDTSVAADTTPPPGPAASRPESPAGDANGAHAAAPEHKPSGRSLVTLADILAGLVVVVVIASIVLRRRPAG
jgi:hypothetical protein